MYLTSNSHLWPKMILKSFVFELRLFRRSTVSRRRFKFLLLSSYFNKQEQAMMKPVTISNSSLSAQLPGAVGTVKKMMVRHLKEVTFMNQPPRVLYQRKLINSGNVKMPSKSNITFRKRITVNRLQMMLLGPFFVLRHQCSNPCSLDLSPLTLHSSLFRSSASIPPFLLHPFHLQCLWQHLTLQNSARWVLTLTSTARGNCVSSLFR